MTRHHIGGSMDLCALATLHRPDDADSLRREAQHLLDRGLTCDDIGVCLGLTRHAVRQLLAEPAVREG
jgi:hypothetical protein